MSEVEDTTITDDEGQDDSEVLKAVRAKQREAEKRAKEAEEKLQKYEAAAQTQRAESAKAVVESLGFGEAFAEDVLGWVEGDVTAESVSAALKSRGIPLPTPGEAAPVTQVETPERPAVSASTVGQQLADAAAGADKRNLDEKLNSAGSMAELLALAEEANLTRDMS